MVRCMIVAAAMLATGCATNVDAGAPQPLSSISAAAADEQIIARIRDLEERERRAVLAGDVAAIEGFWDPAFLVNAPNNRLLVGRDATLDLVRSGVIQFSRFDRVTERVEVEGDVAVTMGSETIVQQRGPQAGQVIQRRFTNMWRLKDGQWRLRFRHANVVPPQPQILEPPRPSREP